jgi:hypothetical protein
MDRPRFNKRQFLGFRGKKERKTKTTRNEQFETLLLIKCNHFEVKIFNHCLLTRSHISLITRAHSFVNEKARALIEFN